MEHELKCWPNFFQLIKAGAKPFEIRKNDRDFQTGDTLYLREWDPTEESYTGDEYNFRVGYMLEGPAFGLKDGYVVMAQAKSVLTTPSDCELCPVSPDLKRINCKKNRHNVLCCSNLWHHHAITMNASKVNNETKTEKGL